MSGSRPGSAAYLGCYKKAVKIINERLDEETRVKYRAEAKKWTEQRPPHGQQQRMFEKHGINTMREFSESMYHQYGVRVAILGGYRDADDEPAIMFYDINNELGGTSFKVRYKDWQRDPMVKDFSKWTAKSFGADPNDDIEEEGQRKDAAPIIKLATDKKGYPMLPSWEAIEDKGLMYKKYLIGKFMSEMYQITISGGKGRVPWARLKEAQGDFILAKYLPVGVTLTQYHHLRLEDTNALLKHWTQRQAASEIPFRFKKLDKADGYEGSLGDIHRHQEQESDKETPGDIGSSTKPGADGNSQGAGAGSPSSPPQPHPHRSSSGQGLGKGAKVCEELPRQRDGGDLPPHLPNTLPPHTRPCPRPHPRPCPHPHPQIITKRHPPTSSSRADQVAEASTDHRRRGSVPVQERPLIDQMAADEHQGPLVAPSSTSTRNKRNNHHKTKEDYGRTADTRPPKRQKVGDPTGGAQPETQRSARATRPTERVKQTQ
ncbi:hypothetical protein BJY52DRAFT_1187564 [Lactarius psammicola]|nr:hypothetical protein BJY52DRAFT_1187564 [Lactarius psammicola]